MAGRVGHSHHQMHLSHGRATLQIAGDGSQRGVDVPAGLQLNSADDAPISAGVRPLAAQLEFHSGHAADRGQLGVGCGDQRTHDGFVDRSQPRASARTSRGSSSQSRRTTGSQTSSQNTRSLNQATRTSTRGTDSRNGITPFTRGLFDIRGAKRLSYVFIAFTTSVSPMVKRGTRGVRANAS